MTHQEICALLTSILRLLSWPLLILALLGIGWGVKAMFQEVRKYDPPQWEIVYEPRRRIWHVRWSEPDHFGLYLYVREYGGLLGQDMAKLDADCLNHEGRSPSYYPEWCWGVQS